VRTAVIFLRGVAAGAWVKAVREPESSKIKKRFLMAAAKVY